MISSRCKGFNLLNHVRQINKIKDLDIRYLYDKSNYQNEWNCVFTFVNQDVRYTYKKQGKTKKKVILDILKENEQEIRNLK